jgi:hypothetical protein
VSTKVLVNLDFNGSQALGLRAELLATDPVGGALYQGRVWFNSTINVLKYYDGTTVISVGVGVASLTVDDSSIENVGSASVPSIRVKALGITSAMLSNAIRHA